MRIGVTGLIGSGELTSDQFQFVSFYSDGDCALDRFDGNHQVLFRTLFENSFQPVETSASNSHPLSYFQKSVKCTGNFLRQQPLQIVNLLGWNWSCHPSDTDHADHALSMEEFNPHSGGQVKMRERVAREEGNIDGLTAIAPSVKFLEQRKERLKTFALKLSRDFPFKPVPGLNRIPLFCLGAAG